MTPLMLTAANGEDPIVQMQESLGPMLAFLTVALLIVFVLNVGYFVLRDLVPSRDEARFLRDAEREKEALARVDEAHAIDSWLERSATMTPEALLSPASRRAVAALRAAQLERATGGPTYASKVIDAKQAVAAALAPDRPVVSEAPGARSWIPRVRARRDRY